MSDGATMFGGASHDELAPSRDLMRTQLGFFVRESLALAKSGGKPGNSEISIVSRIIETFRHCLKIRKLIFTATFLARFVSVPSLEHPSASSGLFVNLSQL